MPNVWHVFSFYNSTFAKREVKEVREFKEFKGVKAICFIAKYNHGKTKSARIQKRNVFSTDKNEM